MVVVDGKEKAVTDNEMSHSDEHNQNLSKTRNLRIRKVKEGDAPADASDSKQKKKKNKTTYAGSRQGVGEVLIALPIPTSRAEIGLRQPPTSSKSLNHGGETHCLIQPPAPISALDVPDATTDINQGDKANSVHPSGSNSSATPLPVSATTNPTLQPEKHCTVKVGSYMIKPEFAATAEYILKRYGDIVACTSYKGSMLAHLLQSVCLIYQKLEMSEFIDLTLADLEDMSIEVSDFLKMNMNVRWLEKRLDDIVNAKNLHQSSILIKDTKRQTQKAIVELENELRIKEEAMQELQFKIEEIKEKLFSEKTKLESLNQTLTKAKENVKRFQKKSLVDEI